MPYLRSGKNVVQEPIKKKKKQSIEEVKEEPVKEVAVVEAAPEVTVEPTTVLEEVKEVITEVKEVVTEVKDIVKEVKEVEEFIEIKDVPVLNKKKGYGCTIC